MCSIPVVALAEAFTLELRRALLAGLCRRFPGLGRELVEDAVQNAALELLASPTVLPGAWSRGGVVEIRRVLMVAAWRGCLRALTGPRARRELLLERLPESGGPADPESLLLCREVERAVEVALGRAARRHGGRRAPQLAAALAARLGADETDTEVARAYGVPRETLNRAKNWMAEQLEAA